LDPYFVYAPAFPATLEEREAYANTDHYREIETKWDKIDTVILSIGNYPSVPDQATALRFGKKLQEQKAVGVFLSYYFNKDGQIISGSNDYVIHIPLEKLGKVPKVVAICLDTSAEAIVGALRTGFITHLITDERTAMEILQIR
jgi:DNA-binding transcriptional regulator LsrR (DeoR family)